MAALALLVVAAVIAWAQIQLNPGRLAPTVTTTHREMERSSERDDIR